MMCTEGILLGICDLNEAVRVRTSVADEPGLFAFEILTCDRLWQLAVNSEDERDAWMAALWLLVPNTDRFAYKGWLMKKGEGTGSRKSL